MFRFGFRSVFSKLFASVMLTLVLFAIAMITLTHLVHDNSANTRWQVLAKQITHQIDPLLEGLETDLAENNLLHARFTLAIIKKSFDIFDESLQANLGLYDAQGRLLVQTDGSDLPRMLPEEQSWLASMLPTLSHQPIDHSVQAVSKNGFTLLYESRQPPQRSELSATFNLLTGTLLLLMIMTLMLWWISHSMTWRLNKMSQQVVQLGEGDFSARVPAQGNDEIASLARGFNQAAQKIEQLINANNLLLAHASHELRTPITRIRLQVEMMDMLASGLPADTKQKFDKRAAAINRDLNGLNELVESILLVSRLDAGHAAQQTERFDLYELILQETQHYQEAQFVGEHIVIQGQPKLLVHLIRNLLNNALIHGVPPIVVQLYGVLTLEEAAIIPEHILSTTDDNAEAQADNKTNEVGLAEKNRMEKECVSEQEVGLNTPQSQQQVDSDSIAQDSQNSNSDNSNNRNEVENKDKDKDDTDLTGNDSSNNNTTPKTTKSDKNKTALLTENRFAKRLRRPKSPIEPPKYAVLAVIDQGEGIPIDKREDIFSPFVRLQQQKKGSGIGLSLVAQIVEAHHGHITTDTVDGHTRFLVVLPVKAYVASDTGS